MAATTSLSEPARRVLRFDGAERIAHWANAVLIGSCIVTAGFLYIDPLSAAVGRRELVKTIHVYSGLALPFPIVLALIGRHGRALRADLTRLNRWTPDDWRWLRSWGRDPFVKKGKFNAGQKLNTAFTGGAILLFLGTGSIMRWFDPFPLAWRTGATFVHDWLAVALFFAVVGHILYAVRTPHAMDGIVSGWTARAPGESVDDVDRGTEGDAVGDLGDVGVAHADAAVADVLPDEAGAVRAVDGDLT
jgi:formate dehydrogenase subunit gamma